MKVYLLDINKQITDEMERVFKNCGQMDDVEVINDKFDHFIETHKDIQGIVSPANSFGRMDGGYDLAISETFGWELSEKVREKIFDVYGGIQPVGSALVVSMNELELRTNDNQKLIHVPSMLFPMKITDIFVIYQCMWSTLKACQDNDIESVVIPAFGGLTGGVLISDLVHMMYLAKLHFEMYQQPLSMMETHSIISDLIAKDIR